MKIFSIQSSLIKKIIVLIIGLFISILSLCFMIKSFTIYDDGYGTDISFDMDMVIFLIIGIAICIYAITCFKVTNQQSFYITAIVISTLISLYPLGTFFKAIAKNKPFIDYQNYLYLGIIGALTLIYFLLGYFEFKKNNHNK